MNTDFECVIIVPTNSTYMDICKNFFSLFSKNWSDCKYKMVFSVCGEDEKMPDCETIYNGVNATLPECILNASNRYVADFYLIFLGDAFISSKIVQEDIEQCLIEMYDNKVNYCRMLPRYTCEKKKNVGKMIRYINKSERYGHSFIAFIATKRFIENEFCEGITDREFELKYLEIASKNKTRECFDDRAVLNKNVFHIMPGIEKGKWDRMVLRKLKHRYPEVEFAQRPLVSVKKELFLLIRRKINPFIPDNIRRVAKKRIRNNSDLYDTEN